MRLCYPSCFVFLTGETLDLLSRNHSSLCEGGGAPDGIGAAQSSSSFSGSSTSSGPPPDLNAKVKSAAGQAGKLLAKTEVFSKKVLAQRVIEKAWQDSTLTSGLVTNRSVQRHSDRGQRYVCRYSASVTGPRNDYWNHSFYSAQSDFSNTVT